MANSRRFKVPLERVHEEDRQIAERFICGLCQNVTYYPKHFINCEHDYCLDCLDNYVCDKLSQLDSREFTCPHPSCNTRFIETETNYEGVKIINKIRLICEHQGCEVLSLYGGLERHQWYCGHRLVECIRCKLSLKYGDLLEHGCCEYLLSHNSRLKEENELLAAELAQIEN